MTINGIGTYIPPPLIQTPLATSTWIWTLFKYTSLDYYISVYDTLPLVVASQTDNKPSILRLLLMQLNQTDPDKPSGVEMTISDSS